MFCVKLKPKKTALFFQSGKFRIMGKLTLAEATHALLLLRVKERPRLSLQTVTIKFKVKPVTPEFALQHQKVVVYEPEIFPAMKITKWKGVHVNLFHSGAVVVLGASAEKCAPLVKAWLDESQGLSTPNMEQRSEPCRLPDYDTIVQCLPTDLRDRAYVYLKHYPFRLLTSWCQRIHQDVALQRQLIKNYLSKHCL